MNEVHAQQNFIWRANREDTVFDKSDQVFSTF
jgi:hypothetical protein